MYKQTHNAKKKSTKIKKNESLNREGTSKHTEQHDHDGVECRTPIIEPKTAMFPVQARGNIHIRLSQLVKW